MKNIFLPIILSIGLASVSFTAIADEKSTLQADLKAGAVTSYRTTNWYFTHKQYYER